MKITLKMARVKAGLKQKDVAEKMHCSRDFIRNIESGKAIPKVTVAFALADLYSINVEEIDFLCQ